MRGAALRSEDHELAGDVPVTLESLFEEVQAIRRLLEERQAPSTLSRPDRAALGRILPAIGGTFGSQWFACRDLFEEDSPALRLVLVGYSAKRVGQLFHRGEGEVVDGYLVKQGQRELNAALWRVLRAV